MNLTPNLKFFSKLVTWPLTYDLFLKGMFVGNGVPWHRNRTRVLLPSVWGLGTYAKVSQHDIDDFHIVRDLDWPYQRSTEVNDLLWRKLSFFRIWQFLGHFATLISGLTHIWVIHGHGVIKGQPRSMTFGDLTWPFLNFCVLSQFLMLNSNSAPMNYSKMFLPHFMGLVCEIFHIFNMLNFGQ